MSNLLNSITFHKTKERDLLHRQLDLLLDLNDRIDPENWENEHFSIMIKDEGEFITLNWCQHYDCEDFIFVDPYHDVVRNNYSAEYLPIDSDGKYTIPLGESFHNYEISGQDLMDFVWKHRKSNKD